MGKSKKSKKGKKGESKKGEKKVVVEGPPPPPPLLNVFLNVRRKNVNLCLESHEEMTVKELKLQVATILHQFPEDIMLLGMLGKKEEEMEENEKEEKPQENKKDDKKLSGSKKKDDKKKGSKSKKSKEKKPPPPKPPKDKIIGDYGYVPANASVFNPGLVGLLYRGEDGQFEKLDVTPFSEFPTIPEEIKMHLRNYVPPPPPKKDRK